MMLFDDEDARKFIRERLYSRRWWVIPYLSQGSSTVAQAVEARYYGGRANRDFQMILGPFQVAFAHKRRMSGEQLASLLGTLAEDVPEDFARSFAEAAASGEQDILIVPTSMTKAAYVAVAEWMDAFQRWLGPESEKSNRVN